MFLLFTVNLPSRLGIKNKWNISRLSKQSAGNSHVEMNYPTVSYGTSKTPQQHENHLEASFRVYTGRAIKNTRFNK
jgi:hypothetical protein